MITETYKDLTVWQFSMDLVVDVYRSTEHFPSGERYGLTSQMRRSSVSVPSNIAEGYRRGHRPEYVHFLSIAYGSGSELETQLEICRRLQLIDGERVSVISNRLDQIMRMLNVMIRRLR